MKHKENIDDISLFIRKSFFGNLIGCLLLSTKGTFLLLSYCA
ncbi:hypothetical protein QY96_03507 [Bacillus thermotolerans]|nr:hypothetical protein QY96_03507 [Bacillus thermotolerans]